MLIKKELQTLPEAKKTGKPLDITVSFAELPRCGKIMVLDVYDEKGRHEGRMYHDGKNITSCDSSGVWNILHRQFTNAEAFWKDRHKISDAKEKQLTCDFLGMRMSQHGEPLGEWARNVRWEKQKKESEERDARFIRYAPLFVGDAVFTKREIRDFDRFVNTLYDTTYGIIDRKKKQSCICGQCREVFEPVPRVKVGGSGVCPRCGVKLNYVSELTPQSDKVADQKFTYAKHRKGAILVGVVNVERSVTGTATRHTYYWDKVNIYPDGEKKNLLYYYAAGSSFMGYYMETGWHELPNRELFSTSKTYTKNLRKVFGESWHGVNIPEFYENYLRKEKLSLDRIVYSAFHGYAEPLIKNGFSLWAAESPWLMRKLLRHRRNEKPCFSSVFGMLPDMKSVYLNCVVTPAEHRVFSNFSKEYISPEEIARYRALDVSKLEIRQKPDFTFRKLLNYLEKQNTMGYSASFALRQLFDYWNLCAEQRIDMTRKSVKWPDNVKLAHDRLLALKNAVALEEKRKAAEEKAKAFLKTVAKISKLDGYTNGVYEIRLPQSFDDFIAEGTALNNCVARLNYYDKQVNGDCYIVFLRRSTEPERPFFCLELSTDGSIRQLHGYGNCTAPADITAFANAFAEKFKKTAAHKKAAAA